MAEQNNEGQVTKDTTPISKDTQLSGQKRPNEGAPVPGKHLLESIKKHKTDSETKESKEAAPDVSKPSETHVAFITPEEKVEAETKPKENIPETKEVQTTGEKTEPLPSNLETKPHGDTLLQKHLETLDSTKPSKEKTEETVTKPEKEESKEKPSDSTSLTSQ